MWENGVSIVKRPTEFPAYKVQTDLHQSMCLSGCFVVSNSLQPHGLQPARLVCPWNFPCKNTGVGCYFLLQGIFLTQGLNPGLLHCRHILYYLSHQGSPLGEKKKKSETLPWIKKVNSILNLCIPSSNIHDENLSSISPNSSWVNPT